MHNELNIFRSSFDCIFSKALNSKYSDKLLQNLINRTFMKTEKKISASSKYSSYSPHCHSVELPNLYPTSKSKTNEDNYFYIYLSLKSQHTILQSLLKRFSKREHKSKNIHTSSSFSLNTTPTAYFAKEIDSENILKDSLFSFLNCSYGELFILTASAEIILHPILNSSRLNSQLEKVGNHFLKSIMCIQRLMRSIQNEFHSHQDSGMNPISPPADQISTFSETKQKVEMENAIVCRICNEHVPIELFEEHTRSCIEAYQTETKLQSIHTEMTYIQNQICEDHLSLNWPNHQKDAIANIIPLFRVSLLLERAYQIDCKDHNAANELFYISEILSQINVEFVQAPFANAINRAKDIVVSKAQTSVVIVHAATILKNTRISGNADTQKIAQIQISDFNFIKRISAGAFARVFLAKMKVSNDIYAIKVLPKDDVVQKNQVKRVVLEKDILLQFNNPYIINFYYSISGTRNLYLVMEYLPGGDLYSLLHNVGCLDENVAKIYVYQIAVALSYLHSKGIIHRDIKPDNILIAADGSLKLTDFGLSYVGIADRKKSSNKRSTHFVNSTTTDEKLVKTRSMVGTPDYIAPEIIENKEHTFAVDWWSLGVALYEFLVGEPPFHADSKEQIYENIKSCKYKLSPYISEMLSSIQNTNDDNDAQLDDDEDPLSQEVLDLIKGLLTKDPSKRLGTTSSDEVLQHPWFSDIDPKNITPPFIPELSSEQDTQYFETRYSLNETDDSDIIDDMQDASRSRLHHKRRSLTLLPEQSESSLLVPETTNKNNLSFRNVRRRNTVTTQNKDRRPTFSSDNSNISSDKGDSQQSANKTVQNEDRAMSCSNSYDTFEPLPSFDDSTTTDDENQSNDDANESNDSGNSIYSFRHSISQVFLQTHLLSDNSSYSRLSVNVSSDAEGSSSINNNHEYDDAQEDSEMSSFPSMVVDNDTLEEKFPSVSISQLKNKNMQAFRCMSKVSNMKVASRSFASLDRGKKGMPDSMKRKGGFSAHSRHLRSNDDMFLPQGRKSVQRYPKHMNLLGSYDDNSNETKNPNSDEPNQNEK